MSYLKQAGFALAAAAMTIGSTAASAAPQPLRADIRVAEGHAMGESGGAWIGILAIGTLIGIFLLLGSETGDDSPTSP
jgi:hypothetical protein